MWAGYPAPRTGGQSRGQDEFTRFRTPAVLARSSQNRPMPGFCIPLREGPPNSGLCDIRMPDKELMTGPGAPGDVAGQIAMRPECRPCVDGSTGPATVRQPGAGSQCAGALGPGPATGPAFRFVLLRLVRHVLII